MRTKPRNATTPPPQFAMRPQRRHRPQWRRAVRALRELLEYPDRTHLAFEVALALDPDMHERALRHMLTHPEGRLVFKERPSLRDALCDREALAGMPASSFGRAYLEHIERHGLDPAKLVDLGSGFATDFERADPDVRWMAERSQMTHDLWHVLTGYGADNFGESTLLVFSHAQTGGLSNVLLSLGANFRVGRERGPRWLGYLVRAWRRGHRAVCLAALPYEQLLPRPLEEVRTAACIEPPEIAHPGGIVRDSL